MKKSEEYKQMYREVWRKYSGTSVNEPTPNHPEKPILERGFMFQFDGAKDIDVLFLGMNPSYDGEMYDEVYTSEQAKDHAYYKALYKVEKDLLLEPYHRSITWGHVDLFAFRETDQKHINMLEKSDEGKHFLYDQLMISKKLIKHINPKVVICSNAGARKFLGHDRQHHNGKEVGIWMDYHFEFDHKVGTKKFVNGELDAYIFFTSMLSGAGTLDNGSRERLIWHLNRVLEELD